MKSKRVLLTICTALLSGTVSAEIYQWVDKQGQRHYTDRPQRGAEVVAVNPGHTFYRVKRVFDGDTVLLTNGQKVRFLGINTPEVEGRNKLAEPGGVEAKRWLSKRLSNQKIRLEPDVEKKDKYGRLLAHVFTEQGQHLNLDLVKHGLATVNIHPPNLHYSKSLLTAEDSAEKAGLGLWANSYYASRSFEEVRDSRGWKRVTGTVKDIRQTRKNIYLRFAKSFSIKIARQDQNLFPALAIYQGKRIEVRGWLNKQRDGYTMQARHPGQIKTFTRLN